MIEKSNQIKSIKIENFRCHKNLTLNLEKCHALIGENGTGKTAILEAINLATSPSYLTSRLDEQDFNINDEGNILIEVAFTNPFIIKIPDGYNTQNIACDKIRLTVKRRERASPGKILSEPFTIEHYAVPLIYSESQKPLIDNIPVSIQETEKGYCTPRKSGTKFEFSKQRLNLQNELEGVPLIFYFDRNREKESKTGFNTLFQRIIKDFNWRYRNSWDQNTLLCDWNNYYNNVIKNISDSKLNQLILAAKNNLKILTGNQYNSLEISLLNIEQPFTKSFFALRDGTNQIETENFGSGISILLSLLLLEEMAKQSNKNIVLLIDEPELHLHSQLQQQVFSYFQSSEYQTIYTTQSDCFLDLKKWQAITRVDHNHVCQPKSEKLNNVFEGKSYSEHLCDIGNYNFHKTIFYREQNQLFFAKKCLLVEGPNDKYGIPILVGKYDININDMTIIMCHGKSKIKHYQLLCLAFNIPFFVVFDEDNDEYSTANEKNSNEKENQIIKALSKDAGCYTFQDSFEKLMSKHCNIPKRSFLSKLEQLSVNEIPQEAKNCLFAIETWSNNLLIQPNEYQKTEKKINEDSVTQQNKESTIK